MNLTNAFRRGLVLLLCFFLYTTYFTTAYGFEPVNILKGCAAGAAFALFLCGIDILLKKFTLRTLNLALLGLFIGYFLGQAVWTIMTNTLSVVADPFSPTLEPLVKIGVFLTTIYLSILTTFRSAEEMHLSIPFVKLQPQSDKKRDILIDSSVLIDARIIDLAASGILDHHLFVPRFILKNLQTILENEDDHQKGKARRCLDVLNKLEAMAHVGLRYAETDFPEAKDMNTKLIRLARLMNASIMTADMNRVEQSSIEGVNVINIHSLSNALKPLTQTGEFMNIKIQRYGKEPRQGVGYLEDGTMVVINGGAEYIGETIKVQVLSVKHTTSGRMIFCNTMEEEEGYSSSQDDLDDELAGVGSGPSKNYYSLS